MEDKMKLYCVSACEYVAGKTNPDRQVFLKTDDYNVVRSLVTMLLSHEYHYIHVETIETDWFELC